MKLILLIGTLLVTFYCNAQDYITRNGNITFYSHTPLEDINAQNNEVASALNTSTGALDFKAAIKSFHFKKAAMEQHFGDEEYMNAEKYPKASFSGKITNLTSVNFTKDGTYKVSVQGNLTLKDVTKSITVDGTIIVKNGTVAAESSFDVNRKDFHVIGQAFVQSKIEDQIHVKINCQYEKR
jgi:polyisoprenoid-binding protein YceI